MDKFYKAKIDALMKERKSHADSIRMLIEKIEDGDTSPVIVRNILHHASALMEVTAEISAYEMSQEMHAIFEKGIAAKE